MAADGRPPKGRLPTNLLKALSLALMVSSNISISATVAANALTIASKGADGNDPSASNPVVIPFRSATVTDGKPVVRSVVAANSLVISSGSTLGTPTGSTPFKIWIVAFDDAGTVRLGAILCTTLSSGTLTQYPLQSFGIASSTAEGGAGAADSAQTFYTGTAVTSKAYTVLAELSFESGQVTAGTWALAPNVDLFGPGRRLPGERVQRVIGAVSTSGVTASGQIPRDNTIPQITEGTEIVTAAIAPSSAANILVFDASCYTNSPSGADDVTMALFKDSGANAIAATYATTGNTNYSSVITLMHSALATSVASATYRLRGGANSFGTYWNRHNTGAFYGGVSVAGLRVEEIAA